MKWWRAPFFLFLPYGAFVGAAALSRPDYTGGPFNMGEVIWLIFGCGVLAATHSFSAHLFPVREISRSRRALHFACWWSMFAALLLNYLKFPIWGELPIQGDWEIWIPTEPSFIFILCGFLCLSFFMGVADPRCKPVRQAILAALAHALVLGCFFFIYKDYCWHILS